MVRHIASGSTVCRLLALTVGFCARYYGLGAIENVNGCLVVKTHFNLQLCCY